MKRRKKTRIGTRRELRITFYKVKKVVFVTYAVITTGAEWKSRFVNEAFILIFAQLTSYILLVGFI